jgi:transcriptional repressor NrdR
MRCPFCGNTDTQVRDSRPTEEHAAIRRRRYCPACQGRFTTFERVQLRDLVVIKTDGRREDFDRDKLARSIRLAMNRRHVEPERLDQLITGIVRRLETSGDTDIGSKTIGDEVMRALERTDPVGYLRYASVYKNFDSVDDFLKFIKEQRAGQDDDAA